MNSAGVRGIRFTQFDPNTATTTMDMIEPLAKRVQALGWHVQIHLRADQIVAAQDLLLRLPGTIVFDHLGRLVPPDGLAHPAFGVIRQMLDGGRTWMKLSGAYFFGGPPDYADAGKVARAYIAAAPERMVWGSGWPHPTEKEKPDDAALFDLLEQWAPDPATRHRILVDNPAKLYGFDRV
jgi:D-galactarolactone isomerase